ncbi:hypothetical protein QR680_002478 [Steinernema hermaphroditum]|uniref:Histone-lysine N-methyltransferase n=1 Tax=Steinernema hermaphroditum TaxID=289476 RepID=A0AA39H2W5_9BILA|nr:hypothetical protein QR680_002478 [Steinernema hermaphroditum]
MNNSYDHIEQLVPGPGVDAEKLFEELFVGCDCPTAVCGENCKCVQYTNKDKNYNDQGRLDKANTDTVVECSDSCACALLPRSCGNRVVQNGIQVKLKMVSIINKGYGILADETIKEGTFVCEYAGELISKEEVEKRHSALSEDVLHNYTFTVVEHFGTPKTSFIDARFRGNIARFVNHSCNPNLKPCIVRINSEAPHIALFTSRQIEKGEEVCYDYGLSGEQDQVGSGEFRRAKRCYCGEAECRGFLPMSFTATS